VSGRFNVCTLRRLNTLVSKHFSARTLFCVWALRRLRFRVYTFWSLQPLGRPTRMVNGRYVKMLSTGLALSQACNASGQQALVPDRDLLPRVLLNPLQLFRRFQKGKALEAVDVMLRGTHSAQGQGSSGTNSAQGQDSSGTRLLRD
jgi:hypothetical protein